MGWGYASQETLTKLTRSTREPLYVSDSGSSFVKLSSHLSYSATSRLARSLVYLLLPSYNMRSERKLENEKMNEKKWLNLLKDNRKDEIHNLIRRYILSTGIDGDTSQTNHSPQRFQESKRIGKEQFDMLSIGLRFCLCVP